MELLLWRWSTSVQITSELIIAVFFVVLARSVRRGELRAWVGAWVANLGALFVAAVFWALQPRTPFVFAVICTMYVYAKTIFVVLLALGAAGFTRAGTPLLPYGRIAASVALFSIVAGLSARSIDRLGVIESTIICLGLAAGAVFLFRTRPPAYAWLATGFIVRAALAAAEALAHAQQLIGDGTPASQTVAIFLSSYSSFDTGAEWMIALGCVLMLYRTILRELTRVNSDLLAARDEMQAMLDHDQLTGVLSRRALPSMLREAQATGAAVLFFDLDGFKHINDAHGHHVGDDCLQRFARALQESFRAGDNIVRYAGDEFLVIAPEIESDAISTRIDALRLRLQAAPPDRPPIRFSVGFAHLPARGDAEAVLRAADEAMYRDKDAGRRGHAARA
jgi:diguanylate cyclase (GGDEF)-like protein